MPHGRASSKEARLDSNFQKCRRNNRILERFHYAKCVGLSDSETKSGRHLSCGSTNRTEPQKEKERTDVQGTSRRNAAQEWQIIRKPWKTQHKAEVQSVKTGWFCVDRVFRHLVRGAHNAGTRVILESGNSSASSGIEKRYALEGRDSYD